MGRGTRSGLRRAQLLESARLPGLPRKKKQYPEHPCGFCDKPTKNKVYCCRRCSGLSRRGQLVVSSGPRPDRRVPVEERFFTFLPDRSRDKCWGWLGNYDRKYGYGLIYDSEKGRTVPAHRVSWEIHKGPIPRGHIVLRTCENWICSNPDHLVSGPRGKIIGKHLRTTRNSVHYGEETGCAKLTDAEVENIRQLSRVRDLDAIKAIAEEREMSYPYLLSVGRSRGRSRKGRTADQRRYSYQ